MQPVAIVILNWNGKELLERFLPSVESCSPAETAEIVVADNGSTDDSLDFLTQHYPKVRQIRLGKNYGFAEGYNRAIAEIKQPYTILLNSDVQVTPGWLDRPLQRLEEDPSIVAVQPKILAQQQRDSFEYAGAAGGYMDRYGYPFCRGRILDKTETDRGQYDDEADILWASGACLFIRTDVYKESGGLDNRFFAHQEEIDLCWRLRNRGYRLVCTPQSVVYHVGGATLSYESPNKTYLNFRNNLLMLYKNLPDKELKPVLRMRFWLDYLAACKFFITGYPQNAKAVFRARKTFYSWLADYEPVRKEYLEKTHVQVIPEILPQSLLFLFYIKGEKTFLSIRKWFKR